MHVFFALPWGIFPKSRLNAPPICQTHRRGKDLNGDDLGGGGKGRPTGLAERSRVRSRDQTWVCVCVAIDMRLTRVVIHYVDVFGSQYG